MLLIDMFIYVIISGVLVYLFTDITVKDTILLCIVLYIGWFLLCIMLV